MPKQYPIEFRQRALRLVLEAGEQAQYETEWAAIVAVSSRLGVNSETLRKWLRRSEVDAGTRPGVTSEEQAEIRRLKKENAELRRANEILRTASAFCGLTRPAGTTMIRYIDENKDRYGVEGICRVLGDQFACGFITASGYWAAKRRRPRPGRCRIGNCCRSSKHCTPRTSASTGHGRCGGR